MDGQIRFEYGYVWTWKFLDPERNSCGLKNIGMRTVDGVLTCCFNNFLVSVVVALPRWSDHEKQFLVGDDFA